MPTTRYAIPLASLSGDADIEDAVNPALEHIDNTFVGATSGPAASRPSPGVPRRLYIATDTGTLSVDIGSAWLEYQAGQPVPVGTVNDFAGTSVPAGWLLCNGQAVARATYSALFTLIGTTYGPGDGSTTFNVPDLRGRATVGAGQGPGLTNRPLGTQFGAEAHQLQTGELPPHNHSGTTAGDGAHGHSASQATHSHTTAVQAHNHGAGTPGITGLLGWATSPDTDLWLVGFEDPGRKHAVKMAVTGMSNTGGSVTSGVTPAVTVVGVGNHTHDFSTGNTGSGQGHANVQPSASLNKIIKA
ncbi:MAG: tail fiber protein [Solirubrobacteraceae bacterium]|nr:tail fiber protein [Solirubrobacteraceae bacterium]